MPGGDTQSDTAAIAWQIVPCVGDLPSFYFTLGQLVADIRRSVSNRLAEDMGDLECEQVLDLLAQKVMQQHPWIWVDDQYPVLSDGCEF